MENFHQEGAFAARAAMIAIEHGLSGRLPLAVQKTDGVGTSRGDAGERSDYGRLVGTGSGAVHDVPQGLVLAVPRYDRGLRRLPRSPKPMVEFSAHQGQDTTTAQRTPHPKYSSFYFSATFFARSFRSVASARRYASRALAG